MKKISAKTITVIGYCLLVIGFTSCNDFLTIYPTDKTIGEDFWKSKEDVKNMVAGAYSQMTSEGCQEKAIVWGSFRSDELVQFKDNGNSDLQNISAVNLLPTNGYNNWGDFYSVINRCNTLIHYAPGVAAIDPAYTESELQANIAEVVGLRSLCYFYLIRAFRDVPFSREAYIDDSQKTLPALLLARSSSCTARAWLTVLVSEMMSSSVPGERAGGFKSLTFFSAAPRSVPRP